MAKNIKIAVIVLIALFILGIIKDQVVKTAVSAVAGNVTGTRVTIGGLSLGVFSQSVRIRDFRMYNPRGFYPQGILVELPKVYVSCDLFSLLRGKLHLRKIEAVLKEVGLEKDKDGRLNVDALKVAEAEEPKESGAKKPGKPLTMQIDSLDLQIGRIVSKDYSAGAEPAIQVYDINLKKSYKNITSAQQLIALILAESLKAAGIRGAKIYGLSMIAGAGLFPVAVVSTLMGKDTAESISGRDFETVYKVALKVLKLSGQIKSEDKAAGMIKADIRGSEVVANIKKISANKNEISISARKYFFPKPEIASGILYQINEELK